MFEKLQGWMEKNLLPLAGKLSSNIILKAISGGFSALLPIIMVGAVASLISGFNIAAWQTFITNTGLKNIATYVANYTTNMVALYAVFSIARAMAENMECKSQSNIVGLLALMTFLLTIPLGVSGTAAESGETVSVAGALSTTYLGSPGLFTAMIIGCVVPAIYNVFIKKNIVIKMPDGVPPMIAAGFSAILPALCIGIVAICIRELSALTAYGTFNDLIYGILRSPLAKLTNSPITFIVFILLCNLLWFFGIHGGMVVMPFLSMLYMAPALENLAAYGAGETIPNILCNTWWFTLVQIGGSGAVASLALLMAFRAKSQRYKSLGRLAVLPALCGISEPIVFGFPLMLNVLVFIPMICAPVINFILSYLLVSTGILPYLNGIQLSTGTPVILSAMLAGGVRLAIWQVCLIAIDILIYLPFFNMLDKQAVEMEASEGSESAE